MELLAILHSDVVDRPVDQVFEIESLSPLNLLFMAPRPQAQHSDDDEWEEVVSKPPASRAAWMTTEQPKAAAVQDFLQGREREKKKRELEEEEKAKALQELKRQREISHVVVERKAVVFGDKGSNWRMMKLKRVFEAAKEEAVEDVKEFALERYGSMDEFNLALEEREFLDRKNGQYVKQEITSGYRAPMKKSDFKAPFQKKEIKAEEEAVKVKPKPIPAAMTSTIVMVNPSEHVLSKDELNKLSSKVMKARLLKSPNLAELEEEYDEELRKTAMQQEIVIVPTMNANGNLIEIDAKKRASQPKTATHDEKGNRISYHEEGEQSLDDLVREEKMKKGDSFDKEIAHQISTDSKYKNSLDYADEASERLSRKRKGMDADKQQRKAIRGI